MLDPVIDHIPLPSRRDQIHSAILQVAEPQGLNVWDILGPRRHKLTVATRHVAIAEVRHRWPQYSTVELGRIFDRDHTSIMYALAKMKALAAIGEALPGLAIHLQPQGEDA